MVTFGLIQFNTYCLRVSAVDPMKMIVCILVHRPQNMYLLYSVQN